jgi:hypothetical protein
VASGRLVAELQPRILAGLPALLEEAVGPAARLDARIADALRERRGDVLTVADAVVRHLVAETAASLLTPGREQRSALTGQLRELAREVGRDRRASDATPWSVLAAYRTAARIAWRRIASLTRQLQLPPAAMVSLGEAVFGLVEDVSAATVDGWIDEQQRSGSARERLLHDLADALLGERVDLARIQRTARLAGWQLPERAAVVLVRPGDQLARRTLSHVDAAVLPLPHDGRDGVVLPDPEAPGRRARLVLALRGAGATVGPAVSITGLAESARIAELAVQVLGTPADGSPVFAADHLDSLIARRDPALVALLRTRVLHRFDDLPPAARQSLLETLHSWLVHMGDRRAVAEELGVHPQTVRYRLQRLRELLGTALDDPRERLRLLLALGWSGPAAAAGLRPPAGAPVATASLGVRPRPRPTPAPA